MVGHYDCISEPDLKTVTKIVIHWDELASAFHLSTITL